MITEFLYEEPFQVVVPQGHKWAKRKSVGAADLAGESAILLGVGHCFRDQVLDACPELNRADSHVTRTSSLETVRNMVASGLGISVLPRDALTPKYHSQLVVPVPFARPAPSRRVAIAHRRSFPRPEAIAAIRAAVAACRPAPAGAGVADSAPSRCRLVAARQSDHASTRRGRQKKGLHLRVTPWFKWWAILGSNQ